MLLINVVIVVAIIAILHEVEKTQEEKIRLGI